MSAQGFKQVFMAGAVGAAALGCYLVSLSVASTRADLESVEGRILMAQRDIRTLETEVGTRGRLAQLERWNANFIRLSAPQAEQFVEGSFQLATLVKPKERSPIDMPVVLASAPAPERRPVLTDDSAEAPLPSAPRESLTPDAMMHTASLRVAPVRTERQVALPEPTPKAAAKTAKPAAAKPAAAKPAKTAMADPLAPLSGAAGKAKARPSTTKE